jgi:hypothetical protein
VTASLAKEIDVGWAGNRGVETGHIRTRWGRGAAPEFASEAARYREWWFRAFAGRRARYLFNHKCISTI